MILARSLAGLLLAFAGSTAFAQTTVQVGDDVELKLAKDERNTANGFPERCVELQVRKGQEIEIFSKSSSMFSSATVYPRPKCAGEPLKFASPPGDFRTALVTAPGAGLSVRLQLPELTAREPAFRLRVAERPTQLRSGETLAGALVRNDLRLKDEIYDCYAFDAVAGQTVRATLRAEDYWLTAGLHVGGDCAGEKLASAVVDRQGEGRLELKGAEAGRYSVRVASRALDPSRYALSFALADASGAPVRAVAALVRDLPPPTGETFADAVAAFDRGELAEAARIFRLEAEAGDYRARLRLARLYEQGQGVARDEVEARKWYVRAAGDGRDDGEAATAAAAMLADGRGGPRDPAEAVRLWERAAGRGRAEAAYRAGLARRDGQGVPRDPGKALSNFLDAARAGYAPAETALGDLYAGGLGTNRDPDYAIVCYARAALLGDPAGREKLTALADQGVASAQLHLGRYYLARGPEWAERARDWLRMAADQKLAAAEFDLGAALAAKPAGDRDRIEAVTLLTRAARDPGLRGTAQVLVGEVAKGLSRDQLARARAAAGAA